MKADEQFTIPPEGEVVGASQDEAHGVAISADERGVLLAGLGGAVSGENSVDLLDRDGDPLHRRRGGYRLSLKVSTKTTGPGSANRTAVVDQGPPAVQLASGRTSDL